MNAPLPGLPPYKTLAAALRKTTEVLAREVVRPSESAPDWNEIEWAIARSVAAMHGITVLLVNRLRWRGPRAWQAFLTQQREQSLLRETRLGDLLARIDSATRDAGIGCVALKGAAVRSLGLYAPGERPSGDIDLLVRKSDAAAVGAVLRRLDYALLEDVRAPHELRAAQAADAEHPRRARRSTPSASKCTRVVFGGPADRGRGHHGAPAAAAREARGESLSERRRAAAALAAARGRNMKCARTAAGPTARHRAAPRPLRRRRLGHAARGRESRRALVDVPAARVDAPLLRLPRSTGVAARHPPKLPGHPASRERPATT